MMDKAFQEMEIKSNLEHMALETCGICHNGTF
jgi:hypothetical protein